MKAPVPVSADESVPVPVPFENSERYVIEELVSEGLWNVDNDSRRPPDPDER